MNLFSYFDIYNNFIKAFDEFGNFDSYTNNSTNPSQLENQKIETFIKCLCKIYIGHNIHQRINNEISKKTNLYILKGDYYITLGYSKVATLGNPLVVRFYSKIAENFAKVKSKLIIKNIS
jgi:hypothetical protein